MSGSTLIGLSPVPGRARRLAQEGTWIVAGQLAAAAGSLVGVRLLTGVLAPAAYGELALGMTVAALTNQLVFGPLGNGAARFYAPAEEKCQLGGYMLAMRRLAFRAAGTVVGAGVVTSLALWITGYRAWVPVVAMALLFSILAGCNSTLNGIQNAARQRSIVAVHQGAEPWARFGIATVLVASIHATSTVALGGYVVALALVLASQYVWVRKIPVGQAPGTEDSEWARKILAYSWPFAGWGVFTWAQLASDRWALGLFEGTQQVGLYAALYQLGYYPMATATGMATQLLAPIFFQRAGDGTDERRAEQVAVLGRRLTVLSLLITGAAVACGALLHAKIFEWLVGDGYAGVSHLLPWMLLGGGLFASAQTLTLNVMSRGTTAALLVPKVTTAVLGIVCNAAGGYVFGVAGVVAAGVVFSGSYLLWMVALVERDEGALARRLRGRP